MVKKYKMCPASLVIREMQIKTDRYYTPTRMPKIKKTVSTKGKYVEQMELSYSACGSIHWYSHSGKLFSNLLKLNTHKPYDLVVQFLGDYLVEITKDKFIESHGLCSSPKLQTTQTMNNAAMNVGVQISVGIFSLKYFECIP